ncbi:IclR family transcriptional regulator [Geminicoccus harenae]|uniref:IclR family transcriptional regulator n=2 Tax=Geminicoccus harenae TaxID=2498453 RepID=UPI001C988C14|nr:IclR family transcriptional regulator [Geminicoccus harenae]
MRARPAEAGTMAAEERRAKYSVPAVEKALDVLEYLAELAVPATQAQLARALGRQPGEIFRLLTCLELRGYLRRDPASGAYALTLKLFELSRTHSPYQRLVEAARPWMRRLAETVRETCHLSVLHQDQVLVLAQEESPRPLRLSVEVGSRHSPLRTASGRIMLAHLPERERTALLDRLPEWREQDAAARDGFIDRLAALRERGHERAEGERFAGILDLGVPVGGPMASIKAALIIATLRQGDGPDLDAMLPTLQATARAIATEAGLRGSPS